MEASLKAMDTQIALISEKLGLPYGDSDDDIAAPGVHMDVALTPISGRIKLPRWPAV
jgi:hypothetical protein